MHQALRRHGHGDDGPRERCTVFDAGAVGQANAAPSCQELLALAEVVRLGRTIHKNELVLILLSAWLGSPAMYRSGP